MRRLRRTIGPSVKPRLLRLLCSARACGRKSSMFRYRPFSSVAVAMSGGVDSSVAALLLHRQGHSVRGVYMRNWDELDEDGQCRGDQDARDAESVCAKIGIPFYRVDFVKVYWHKVFSRYIEALERGETPNADAWCNRFVKFEALLHHVLGPSLGGEVEFLATGHYCGLDFQMQDTRESVKPSEAFARQEKSFPRLLTSHDNNKDQSYFLCMVKPDHFRRVLFPLATLTKGHVRALAQEAGLPTASKKESFGLCYIGKRNYNHFISGYVTNLRGLFINIEDGSEVGNKGHDGLAHYTSGQRAYIEGSHGNWFVCGKDAAANRVMVATSWAHPALFSASATAQISWLSGSPPMAQGAYFNCLARTRHRRPLAPCRIRIKNNSQDECKFWAVEVEFEDPQRALCPGQILAVYVPQERTDRMVCLGGGPILEIGPTLFHLGMQVPSELSDPTQNSFG